METDDAMQLLLSDRALFIETLLEIDNKERQLVPFVLNPIQMDIATTSGTRDIYVKPSQVGFSSIIIADFLVDALTMHGTVAVIISYDEFIAGRLLRKAQIFYDALKQRIPSIPELHHKSTYEKTFPDMGSSFYIGSARSFVFGRGETIHDMFADEYAFWQQGDAERILMPTLQRVPVSGKVRIGSTPNGEDNEFYEMYLAAKEGHMTGRSVFTHHFYPWMMHPEYALSADSPYILIADRNTEMEYTPDEQKLRSIHGVNDDQLRWRRRKIAEMESLRRSGETRLLFSQEYPENDVDCFLAAGDMVYDTARINELSKDCYTAPYSYMGADIWYRPEEGLRYLIGIDPGLGKESMSVATVWHFNNGEFKHCATLAGLYPPEIMAEKSIDLGRHFNNAVLAGEANIEFVNYLKDYPNLYYREDIMSGKPSNHIGWLTTPRTKPYMITEVNKNLNHIKTHDSRLVSQLRNIRWYGERAISIGSDDFHDSAAIAIVCRTSLPVVRGCGGETGWNW